jgi:hypothetical protein
VAVRPSSGCVPAAAAICHAATATAMRAYTSARSDGAAGAPGRNHTTTRGPSPQHGSRYYGCFLP